MGVQDFDVQEMLKNSVSTEMKKIEPYASSFIWE